MSFVPTVMLLGEPEALALLKAPAPEMAFYAAWAMQTRHGPAAISINGPRFG